MATKTPECTGCKQAMEMSHEHATRHDATCISTCSTCGTSWITLPGDEHAVLFGENRYKPGVHDDPRIAFKHDPRKARPV